MSERVTPGGVILPPREQGHCILVLQTKVSQLQYNVAVDVDEEGIEEAAEVLAARLSDLQEDLSAGAVIDPSELKLRDPHFGYEYALTREGIRSILSVAPAYAQKIDPSLLVRAAEESRKQPAKGGRLIVPRN